MSQPRFSVCELTTPGLSLEQDLTLYRQAGLDGIGVCEAKLAEDADDGRLAAAVQRSGLTAAVCLPATLSILPLPKFPGPTEPRERVQALVAGIRRLARFQPACCYCLTGPRGALTDSEARRVVVDGLRRVSDAAGEAGVRVGVEPIHSSIAAEWTIVSTIPETIELLEEIDEPGLGVGFDTWHLWDTPGLLDEIGRHADLFVGVHVSDHRAPTRGWNDRALPGDGTIDLAAIFAALRENGYSGWYDAEILSDDGTFENDYEDSLWKLPPEELLRRCREGFKHAWEASR